MFKNRNALAVFALCLFLLFFQSYQVAGQVGYLSTGKNTIYQMQFSTLECRLNSSVLAVGQVTLAIAYAYNGDGSYSSLEGYTVIFTTGNAEIASVDGKGIVTALAEGTVNINVTVIKDGDSQSSSAVLWVGTCALSDDLSDYSKLLSLSSKSYFTRLWNIQTYPYIWYAYAKNESLIYKSNSDITNIKIKALRNGEAPQSGTYDLQFYVSNDNVKYIDVSSKFTRVRTKQNAFTIGDIKLSEDTFTCVSLPSEVRYIKIVNADYSNVSMQSIEALCVKPLRILGEVSKNISDNKLNVTFSVKNNNISNSSIKTLFVIYNNGMLKSFSEKLVLIESNNNSTITFTVPVTPDIANCKFKIMIWDDGIKQKPLLHTYRFTIN